MVFDGLLMVSVAVSVSHKPSLDLGVFRSIFLIFGEFRIPPSPLELEPAREGSSQPELPKLKWNFPAMFGQLEPDLEAAGASHSRLQKATHEMAASFHHLDTARASSGSLELGISGGGRCNFRMPGGVPFFFWRAALNFPWIDAVFF